MQKYDKINSVLKASKQTPSPEKPAFTHPKDPTEIERMTPNVTYDRALGHMVDNFSEVNMDQLREFYYTLPHENKPDLKDLRIHFSASYLKEDVKKTGVDVADGQFYPYGLKSMEKKRQQAAATDGIDMMPTICVFVGSMLMEEKKGSRFQFATQTRHETPLREMESENKNLKAREKEVLGRLGTKQQEIQPQLPEINIRLRQTLSHELVHFAQMDAEEVVPDRVRNLGHAALACFQEMKASIATGVATSGAVMAVTRTVNEGLLSPDIPPTWAAGLGLAVAAMHHKTRPKNRQKKYQEYLAIDIEQDARNYENPELELVGAVPKDTITLPIGYSPKSFVKDLEPSLLAPLKRRNANRQHTRLAMTPPKRD